LEEVPKPEVKDGDILLKVNACAICGTDVKVFTHGYRNMKLPQIIGHEICGTIDEMGKHVAGFEVGEKVSVVPIVSCGECRYCLKGFTHLCVTFQERTEAFGFYHAGGFAEYMAVPGRAIKRGNLVKVPPGVSDEEAAIAEPMACALNGHMMADTGIGDEVLIIGAGPIGCMHIGLAKALGATKVIVAEIKEERLKLAGQFGADLYINPEKENLKERVLMETDGYGPSVVILAAPSKEAQKMSLELAAYRGHIDFFGGLPKGDSCALLDSNLIHYKELYVHGSSGSTAQQIKMCLDLMNGDRIDGGRFISKVRPLEELPRMLQEVQKANLLKIIIKPS
jgi:L-iditol 2-dehydrogenase